MANNACCKHYNNNQNTHPQNTVKPKNGVQEIEIQHKINSEIQNDNNVETKPKPDPKSSVNTNFL